MRTITIPISKLIKFIPSEPDGGVIPGAVIGVNVLSLVRENPHSFILSYAAFSQLADMDAHCRLDEELEFIPDSNARSYYFGYGEPTLVDDGVTFKLVSGLSTPQWVRGDCEIPNPFCKFGDHQLSHFTRCGIGHIASLDIRNAIQLAIVTKDANMVSQSFIDSPVLDRIAAPCRASEGWLIPWSSENEGINITWLSDREMTNLIAGAVKV